MPSNSRTRRRCLLRAYRKTLGPIVAASLVLGLGGCGEQASEASTDPQVTLEVQVPVSDLGTAVASMDYEIACDKNWSATDEKGTFVPSTRRDGTMDLAGPAAASSGAEPPAFNLWRATEQPLDGLCLVNLIGRDEREQAVCASTETFQASDGQATFVDTVMTCKDSAGFRGRASLAVDLPGLVPGEDLQTVEFTIACSGDGTAFFEGMGESTFEVTIDGNLEVVEDPDRGGIDVWQSFVDLPTGPCTMQLRARDPDGGVICLATNGFVIAPNETTKVQIVLLCGI